MADTDTTTQTTAAEASADATATDTPQDPGSAGATAANPVEGDQDRQVFESLVREGALPQDDTGQPEAEAPDESGADAQGEGGEAASTAEADDEPESESKQDAEDADGGEPDVSEVAKDPTVNRRLGELGIGEDEMLDTALEAVRRDGLLDADEIAAQYRKDPAKFVARALKRAKAQRDQDRFGSEYRQWKQSRQQDSEQEQKPADEADTAESGSETDFSKVINDKITEVLEGLEKDEVYSDLKEPLGVGLTTVANAVRDTLSEHYDHKLGERDQKIDQLSQQLQQVQQQRVSDRLEQQRQHFADTYPDLKDEKAYARVLKRYDTLVESGDFSTIDDAFREAARWELGESSIQSIKQQMLDRGKKRRQGSPSAQPTQAEKPAKQSPDQRDRNIFNEVMREAAGAA